MTPYGDRLRWKSIFFMAAASCAFSGLAHASIAVVLDGSPEFNGTDYTWTYAVDLGPGEGVGFSTPAFFTIYDFTGLDSVISAPSGWSASVQPVGITPTDVVPSDDPAIENVTFSYNGPLISGPMPLGDFVLTSQDGDLNPNGNFSFQTGTGTIETTFDDTGTIDQGIGTVTVPTTATPEPKLEWLIGLGGALLGLGIQRRNRPRRTVI